MPGPASDKARGRAVHQGRFRQNALGRRYRAIVGMIDRWRAVGKGKTMAAAGIALTDVHGCAHNGTGHADQFVNETRLHLKTPAIHARAKACQAAMVD
jgi:ATP:corrinoid adenosyltransferase